MQVSVGTLLAFTVVAISVLILRYVPPDEVPLPPSFQEAIDAVTIRYSGSEDNADITKTATVTTDSDLPLLVKAPVWHPLPEKAAAQFSCKFLDYYSYNFEIQQCYYFCCCHCLLLLFVNSFDPPTCFYENDLNYEITQISEF